jgi:hypothetical protein
MALSGICTWTNHGIVWTNQYFLLGFDKLPMDIMLGSRFSRARDRAWKKPWKIRLWLMEALHGLCMSEVRVYLGACATWNEVQKKRPNDSTVGAHNLVNCWNWPFTSECPAFLGCVFFKDHEMKMQKDTGDLTHTKHPPINKHRLLNC